MTTVTVQEIKQTIEVRDETGTKLVEVDRQSPGMISVVDAVRGIMTLAQAQDVDTSSKTDGSVLGYSATVSKWVPVTREQLTDGGNF